ncbi:trehalose-phosphatase [Sulfitobacter sp. BDSS02]|uniref:trehalose-phosphatase n=1 Tax=Roseobacteraceae TaxID=2854170 RepID=UPI001185AFE7|nr:trehalose-phosphatase [Phaeobacter sp. 22II1-1F12B]MBL3706100.1 trehalose-phosphatase [Sulfitobacter sp. BDSS02]MBR9852858.1 trehalose-phosphatase [Paracoccaceae bacterium]
MMNDLTTPAPVDWKTSAIYLDFDGTLVDLAPRPDEVWLPERESRLLTTLSKRCEGGVAILSGRDLENLRPFLRGLPVILSGSHGAQIEINGDPTLVPGADWDVEAVFHSLKPFAEDNDLLIERKTAAIAVHYRTRPDLANDVKATVERLASSHHGLKPVHGKMVSELASNEYNKGSALIQLSNHPQFAGRMPVAVGDDTTDEDMFVAAQSIGGIGIKIGLGRTAARYRFKTRRNFVTWLSHTLEID